MITQAALKHQVSEGILALKFCNIHQTTNSLHLRKRSIFLKNLNHVVGLHDPVIIQLVLLYLEQPKPKCTGEVASITWKFWQSILQTT